jgi:thioredoxin-dependent peroxiredoxin
MTGRLSRYTFAVFWGFALAACKRGDSPTVEPAVAAAVPQASAPGKAPALGLLAAGAPLPDVSGVAQSGETLRFSDLKGKPVVVYFYPKDDTPGCTVEAQEIRDLFQDIQKTSAIVIGVSSDDDASHKAFAEKYALPFVLLPDPEHRIAEAFKVPLKNGRAARVSFVFGRDGKLAAVFPAVNPRGHAQELLTALRALPAG